MRILLVPDPTSPNVEDAFCRDIAKRAPARGHSCEIRAASAGHAAADAVVVNSLQVPSLEAARAAGTPVVLRLIDSYAGSPEAAAAARGHALASDRVVVPSAYLKGIVAGWGVPEGRIVVAPYAYDQIFAQQIALVTMRAARPSGFGLVTAGVMDAANQAAFETVLSAVSRLRLDCHLAVIGDGPGLPALKARAEQLMLGSKVTFLGDLPHPKKMEYLRAAKAYIEPSGLQGFPSFALHAMSEGCPVVGAAAGSVPELVSDGVNGLLVPAKDEAALTRALYTLADDPELRRRFGAAGLEITRTRFSVATMAAEMEAFYLRSLAERHGR